MNTRFFKFTSEAAAQAALIPSERYSAPVTQTDDGEEVVDEGGYRTGGIGWGMDVVGVITEGGEYDPETGEELVAPTTLPGFHINLIGEVPEELEQYEIFPETPVRKFL